jgi:tetratricopeptide (TPR) repeat protein
MSDADKGAATREALEAARGAARAGRFDQAGRLLDDLGEVPAPLRALREEVASWLTARRQEAESRAREEERREQERRRRARGGEAQKAVERGIQLFGEGRSTEAIAEWRRALELDPDHLLAAQMLEEIGET